MTKQVVSSPKNKKAFAAQQAIAQRMGKSRAANEAGYKAGGHRLKSSKKQ